jgi:hypothetical protein
VRVDDLACTLGEGGGSSHASAKVVVTYDGSAAGTLKLTWWRSDAGRQRDASPMSPTQTAKFPAGASSYTFTGNFSFRADARHPYVGVTVTTDPAAGSGNGTTKFQVCR